MVAEVRGGVVMSTVMYNFRVSKQNWWETIAAIRKYFLAHYPPINIIREAVEEKAKRSDGETTSAIYDVAEQMGEKFELEFQVFDEGETWLLRPLRWRFDHFTIFSYKNWGIDIKPVFYDNRSDVPEEEERNARVVEWCEEKIKTRQYFTVPVVDQDDFTDIVITNLFFKEKQPDRVPTRELTSEEKDLAAELKAEECAREGHVLLDGVCERCGADGSTT